ncbi:hypothetical protein FRC08_018701 [Ceratobasidium sp. 394]|nr:hypothetical protein FRC08_018701 [Ceratobasidium sp. 394]
MPTLARTAFAVGFPPPKSEEESPYNALPWTNPYFCQQLGLAKLGEGLDGGFTDEFYKRMTQSQKDCFQLTKLEAARSWLIEVQKRYREDSKTYILGMKRIPGAKEYTEAMKVLVNIPNGIRDIVWNAMVLKKATPADGLRDVRINAADIQEEDDLSFDEGDEGMIPPSENYYGHVSAHLARALFGEDAINPRSQSVKDKYNVPLKALFSRTWEVKKEVLKTAISKRKNLPGLYAEALKAAQQKPTAKNLMAANKALSDWRAIADLTGETDATEFSQQDARLKELWELLGRSRDKNGVTRRTKATKQVLCSQSELDAAYEHYLELHFPHAGALDTLLEGQNLGDPEDGQLLLAELQFGQAVQDMQTLRVPDLVQLAGLPPDSSSFPLAEPGTLPSEPAAQGSPAKPAIIPDWHQWTGALGLVRAWFTTELGEPAKPLLLCDEVGLGKTLQMVMSVTLLVHLIENQSRGLTLPPLLQNSGKQFFAGCEQIPSLPILVIVPIAVSSQWRDEIIRYTKHGSFQVVLYSRSIQSRQEFFKPGGIWDQAVVNSPAPHRTIIIAEFNTISKEAEECLRRPPRDKTSTKLAHPNQLIDDPGPTIFSMMFLLALIDEIHALRNINWLWEGVLALMCNSCVRQAASATPIWTGYKDVISALKLLRHPSLIDQRGVVLGDKLEELEKEAGQRWKDTETVEEFSKVIAKKRLQVEQQVVSEESIAESAEVILNVQKKNLRSFFTSYPCISYLKQLLGSVIIRRGIQDLDPDGRPVLKLEPYIESIVYLILTPTESEAIKEISAKKPSSVTGKAGEVAWVNFFIDYRYVTFHWRLLNRKELEIDWKSWTMEDFQEMASSKLRVIIKIIFHYKDNPNAAPLFFARDDGQPAALPVPTSAQLSDEVPHRLVHHGSPSTIQTTAPTITDPTPRKFIIFAMFHIPRQIIRKVLELHGIQYRELDGTMTIKARNVALKQFLEDEQILVLLMSNVGSVMFTNGTNGWILLRINRGRTLICNKFWAERGGKGSRGWFTSID